MSTYVYAVIYNIITLNIQIKGRCQERVSWIIYNTIFLYRDINMRLRNLRTRIRYRRDFRHVSYYININYTKHESHTKANKKTRPWMIREGIYTCLDEFGWMNYFLFSRSKINHPFSTRAATTKMHGILIDESY